MLGFDRPRQDISIGREHRAARDAVVLIDMTSFTKFEISGSGAAGFLQYLAVANVERPPGSACYTQLCNARGGIEADVTLLRRSEDCFWLITGSAFGVRDRNWIDLTLREYRQSRGKQGAVEIRDITSAYGVLNLAGPLSRAVLQKVCDEDVSQPASRS